MPIRNTLSQLQQAIRFLVANDMLVGVEETPGEAEALLREQNAIEIVGDQKQVYVSDLPRKHADS